MKPLPAKPDDDERPTFPAILLVEYERELGQFIVSRVPSIGEEIRLCHNYRALRIVHVPISHRRDRVDAVVYVVRADP